MSDLCGWGTSFLIPDCSYTPHDSGYQEAVRLSEEHAIIARREVDTDDPSIDALQALLLLVIAFTASGKGKKAYMLMCKSPRSNGIGVHS
jgi:hypothetical protein